MGLVIPAIHRHNPKSKLSMPSTQVHSHPSLRSRGELHGLAWTAWTCVDVWLVVPAIHRHNPKSKVSMPSTQVHPHLRRVHAASFMDLRGQHGREWTWDWSFRPSIATTPSPSCPCRPLKSTTMRPALYGMLTLTRKKRLAELVGAHDLSASFSLPSTV